MRLVFNILKEIERLQMQIQHRYRYSYAFEIVRSKHTFLIFVTLKFTFSYR